MTSLIARGLAIPNRLQPTDLVVEARQCVALIGPNGGGKTSLLRALAGVEGASGEVEIDGERSAAVAPARRRKLLAFLPASRDVAWPIAARDVIALGLGSPDGQRVEELITLFELEPLATRPIDRLSTGERARVLMARALAAEPKVLLLDEPLSNLDPYWVLRFLEIFDGLRDDGRLLLVALHDLAQLPRFDRALLIDQGRLICDAAPERVVADARFERSFRICASGEGWAIRPSGNRQSSP